jgi:hypothetical protein
LLHWSVTIYALLVSCPNLSLNLVRNAVCVGHGGAATHPPSYSVEGAENVI